MGDGRSYTKTGAVRTLLTGRPTCLRHDGACFDDGTDMDRTGVDRVRGSSAANKEHKRERAAQVIGDGMLKSVMRSMTDSDVPSADRRDRELEVAANSPT